MACAAFERVEYTPVTLRPFMAVEYSIAGAMRRISSMSSVVSHQ